jgi:DNA repair protein RadC
MNTSNNEGHRQRLREKFLKSGLDGFHDYEIIELLLTLGQPLVHITSNYLYTAYRTLVQEKAKR